MSGNAEDEDVSIRIYRTRGRRRAHSCEEMPSTLEEMRTPAPLNRNHSTPIPVETTSSSSSPALHRYRVRKHKSRELPKLTRSASQGQNVVQIYQLLPIEMERRQF